LLAIASIWAIVPGMLTIVSMWPLSGVMLTIVSTSRPVYTAKELGEAIRRTRREQGLTQIALAERTNVARGAVQKIESGRGTVNLPTVLKILRTLSLDLSVSSRMTPIRAASTNKSRIPPTTGPATVRTE
jgi:DNA-binding XRE family transcriptional regulator